MQVSPSGETHLQDQQAAPLSALLKLPARFPNERRNLLLPEQQTFSVMQISAMMIECTVKDCKELYL